MIKVENLPNDWKEFKIHDINLQIKENEYFVICLNRSGKAIRMEDL